MKKQTIMSATAVAALTLSGHGISTPSLASAATTLANTASIKVNGHTFASNVPEAIRNGIVWLPLQTVIKSLTAMGLQVTSNNTALLINNLALQSSALLLPHSRGSIDIADGSFEAPNVPLATLKTGSGWQTFIPIRYVIRALSQGNTGYFAKWKAEQLSLTNDSMGAPSTDFTERVMASTTEVNDPTEHFTLSSKPVTITTGNGDTVTACVGTRTPSADGYGQAVFFFHNQQFVGVDSDMEKSQIQSLKATSGGIGFDVTYANYAKGDAMYDPTLPPVTVTYSWDGSTIVPNGHETILPGANNQIHIKLGSVSSLPTTTLPEVSETLTSAKQAIAAALKPGDTLLNLPGYKTPYLPVDLNGNGDLSYAAAYKPKFGGVGITVVGSTMSSGWKVLFQKVSEGGRLQELTAGPMTGDGTSEIAFQSYVGDGANDVYVLKDVNGAVKPILHVLGSADIGDYNGLGQMEVAVWQHDTGPTENIQLYAWNTAKYVYEPAKNNNFPNYFGVVWNYNEQVFHSGPYAKVDFQAPKMADGMWAPTYLEMGIYPKAAAVANAGLHVKDAAVAYPPNSVLRGILRQASIRASELKAYISLPSPLKHAVDTIVTKYSNFYDPLARSTPLVSHNKNGTYAVTVIGAFDRINGSVSQTGTELAFKLTNKGVTTGPIVLRDPFGTTVR